MRQIKSYCEKCGLEAYHKHTRILYTKDDKNYFQRKCIQCKKVENFSQAIEERQKDE